MTAPPLFGFEDYNSFPLSPSDNEDFDVFQQIYNETVVDTCHRPPSPEQSQSRKRGRTCSSDDTFRGSSSSDSSYSQARFSQLWSAESKHQSPTPEQPEQKKARIVEGPSATQEARRRSGSPDSVCSEETEHGGNGPGCALKVTDAIDRITAEGNVLKFDPMLQAYVVLDGPGFEARFQQLRLVRAKRNENAQARPFSKLHVHYLLVRGSGWGKTGAVFKAKGAASELHACDRVHASKVLINLMPSDETESFQVTLQHFLNVIGAGDAYKQAKMNLIRAFDLSCEAQTPGKVDTSVHMH